MVPASFNGRSPSDGSYQVASLPPYPIVEQETEIVYALPDSPRGEVDRLIAKYAAEYEVPETLVRRVVKRESNFNPRARNRVYWGLMQIRHDTARGMGYEGNANGLLDAETNLKYAVKYLRGAWIVAEGNPGPGGALLFARLLLRRQAQGPARRDRARQGSPPHPRLTLTSLLFRHISRPLAGVFPVHAGVTRPAFRPREPISATSVISPIETRLKHDQSPGPRFRGRETPMFKIQIISAALAATVAIGSAGAASASSLYLPEYAPIPLSRADALQAAERAEIQHFPVIQISTAPEAIPAERQDVRIVGTRFLPDRSTSRWPLRHLPRTPVSSPRSRQLRCGS